MSNGARFKRLATLERHPTFSFILSTLRKSKIADLRFENQGLASLRIIHF